MFITPLIKKKLQKMIVILKEAFEVMIRFQPIFETVQKQYGHLIWYIEVARKPHIAFYLLKTEMKFNGCQYRCLILLCPVKDMAPKHYCKFFFFWEVLLQFVKILHFQPLVLFSPVFRSYVEPIFFFY